MVNANPSLQANLRMGRDIPYGEKKRIVKKILNEVSYYYSSESPLSFLAPYHSGSVSDKS